MHAFDQQVRCDKRRAGRVFHPCRIITDAEANTAANGLCPPDPFNQAELSDSVELHGVTSERFYGLAAYPATSKESPVVSAVKYLTAAAESHDRDGFCAVAGGFYWQPAILRQRRGAWIPLRPFPHWRAGRLMRS